MFLFTWDVEGVELKTKPKRGMCKTIIGSSSSVTSLTCLNKYIDCVYMKQSLTKGWSKGHAWPGTRIILFLVGAIAF